jgi:digeranylgeranylglycerophospholipid reductase
MKLDYDVIVIGAGPAGSIAARTTAQQGLATLLVEKRQEIGSPVRCAEAVGRETLAQFISLDERWIAAEIDTFSLTNVNGETITLPPLEKTLVLERKIFDRELACTAAVAGAEVIVKARAVEMCREPDGRMRVTLNVQGEPRQVSARIVIGADGTEGESARWAGLKSVPALKDYYVAAQYLLAGVSIDQRICQYHLGWQTAPAGYAWVFPKGEGKANVGLVVTPRQGEQKHALDYLNAFVQARFPGCSVLAQVTGGIPITNVLPRMVADGYMAVGDAAHQSDPLTAGGITNGMHGGLFAGQVAAEAIRSADTSVRFLARYEQRWDAAFGKLYRRLVRIRQAVLKVPDDRLAQMIAAAAALDAQSLSLKDLFLIVVKTQPDLLREALPYFLGQ